MSFIYSNSLINLINKIQKSSKSVIKNHITAVKGSVHFVVKCWETVYGNEWESTGILGSKLGISTYEKLLKNLHDVQLQIDWGYS